MTGDVKRYANWRAVESAIKAAALRVNEENPSRQVGDLIRQAHYDRFLSRVFSEGAASEWVLKGGSGMLARVPNSRRTLDVDLYREGYDKHLALTDLRRLAEVDLGDYFVFTYTEHHPILTDDLQPYADGFHVAFDASLDLSSRACGVVRAASVPLCEPHCCWWVWRLPPCRWRWAGFLGPGGARGCG